MKWVSATDLNQWADRLDSRALLPELIRRLIRATAEVEHLDFPGGESIQNPGWDGLVKTKGASQFVPLGASGWECGCNARVKEKADDDFEKRILAPAPLLAASAFIFVTPRRWAGKREWIAQKTGLGPWTEVRAYDADDLEQWLELAPSVGVWLVCMIGHAPAGAVALDDWWGDWANSTHPPLSPGLLTIGRTAPAKAIHEWLDGPPRVLSVEADTWQEAAAFLAAVVTELPPERADKAFSRALILLEIATARELPLDAGPLLVVMAEIPDPMPQALARHHVYLCHSRGASGRPEVRLGFQRRREFEAALHGMGLKDDRAARLAHEVGCSVSVLRRRIAQRPLPPPAWARPEMARQIIPGLLAVSWDEAREGDQRVLASLAGEPYDTLAAKLQVLAMSADAPVRRSGSAWHLTSERDCFFLVARLLTRQDLDRFQNLASTVLAMPDPKRELEPQKRWMASVYGKEREHSENLRQGLVSSLAMVAVFGEAAGLPDLPRAADRAEMVIRNLMANADAERWASIADVLPVLAEAAPDAFLSAVEASLEREDRPVMVLFEETPSPLSASAGHTHLLWALEASAWEPRFVGRVALILAQLDGLDPGGKLANRPAASLRNLFLPWHPQCGASLAQRHAAVEMLLREEPEAAWKLLLAMTPQQYDFCSPTYRPRWRESPAQEVVAVIAWAADIEWLTDRLVSAAGADGARWAAIAEIGSGFPPQQRERVWRGMAEATQKMDSGALDLWAALRGLIGNHRRFHDANWAMPVDEVNALEVVYDTLTPPDQITRSSWLFDHNPPILNPPADWQDHGAFDAAADQQRQAAIQSVMAAHGIEGMFALARAARQPWMVGDACAKAFGDSAQFDNILDALLASPDQPLRAVGRALVSAAFCERGWVWVDAAIADAPNRRWGEDKLAEFLHGLPFGVGAWQRAARLGPPMEARFWAETGLWGNLNAAERAFAIGKLVEARRPVEAMEMASMAGEPVAAELVLRILKDVPTALKAGRRTTGGVDSFHIERLFIQLDKAGADRNEVARLEVPYLECLRDWKRPSALHSALCEDPSLFAELIAFQFKPASAGADVTKEPDPTPEMIARAQAAHTLLNSWRGLPGCTAGTSVNTAHLKDWVRRARAMCADSGRAQIGDQQIGAVLARAPADEDGIWPTVPIREIIEAARSQELETGIEVGVANLRGVHVRSLGDGGEHERILAARYRGWAEAIPHVWPRTSAVLARIAEHYEQLGVFQDRRSDRIEREL